MPWEKLLDNIRQGKIAIGEISDNGLPSYAVGMPYFELMQLVAALTKGYMANYNKIRSLRNMVKRETEE